MSATDSPTSPPAPTPSNLPPQAAAAAHSAVSTASKDEGDLTVLSSPTDFTVKHPLYSPWTLWFDSASKQDKAKSWEEALTKVISFQSVEEFWGLYNNIVPPSMLGANSNYYLFKQGIKPAWEDEANAHGGKWSVQLPRGNTRTRLTLSGCIPCMLAAIGETFETPFVPPSAPSSSDAPSTDSPAQPASSTPAPSLPPSHQTEITGVIVSARKAFYRINIWTRSASPPSREKIENVGRQFKYSVLGFEYGGKVGFGEKDKVSSDVEFVSHKDSQNKGNKNRWTV
uniref:BY PROTMAP: gi/472580413/gb/EMS18217.1/ cap binding protein [Rhodosporidium toruloides NP11] gi/647403679/emb/CDR49763.1/ RHTO0S32e00342g1_1 [Rhodosporidium toruloides] n=1 Tax=Rhodotorula toruloides TaxID=5286 RepID=A0A0K3CQ53_RHOTO